MSDQNQKPAVTAAFPPPPPFWKHFTRRNVEALEERKREYVEKHGGSAEKLDPAKLREMELPDELRYLVPPEIPEESYELFGEMQNVKLALPSLESQGITQLFPAPDSPTNPSAKPPQPRFWLPTITKYILLNFLELVDLLSRVPEAATEKINDMRNLFINAHHFLNTYRPHQARETLIGMMEEQLRTSRAEIEEMERVRVRTEEYLRRLEVEGRGEGEGEGEGEDGKKDDKAKKEEKNGDDDLFEDDEEEEGEEGLEGSYGGDEAGHHQDASRALAEWKDMWASLGSG